VTSIQYKEETIHVFLPTINAEANKEYYYCLDAQIIKALIDVLALQTGIFWLPTASSSVTSVESIIKILKYQSFTIIFKVCSRKISSVHSKSPS